MSADELKTTLDNIVNDLNAVADVAAGVDPDLIPFIAIGKAIDKQIPGLAAAVDGWLQGNPPTEEEKAETHRQLSVLNNPDLP